MQEFLDPAQVRIVRDAKRRPVLKSGESEKAIYRALKDFPVTSPDRYISLLDEDGNEIGTVKRLKDLDPSSREVLSEELAKAYFVPRIKKVLVVKELYGGVMEIAVETDRGYREFEIRSRESVRFVGLSRLMITDVDGNKYEVSDIRDLDSRSRSLLSWMG